MTVQTTGLSFRARKTGRPVPPARRRCCDAKTYTTTPKKRSPANRRRVALDYGIVRKHTF